MEFSLCGWVELCSGYDQGIPRKNRDFKIKRYLYACSPLPASVFGQSPEWPLLHKKKRRCRQASFAETQEGKLLLLQMLLLVPQQIMLISTHFRIRLC